MTSRCQHFRFIKKVIQEKVNYYRESVDIHVEVSWVINVKIFHKISKHFFFSTDRVSVVISIFLSFHFIVNFIFCAGVDGASRTSTFRINLLSDI